jgi:hypothetical protein
MGNLLKSIVLAGASILATAGVASASLVIESWNGSNSLKAAVVSGGKNILVNYLGLPSLGGYQGSQIALTKDAKVTYTFLGFEAGYANYFVAGTNLFGTEAFGPSNNVLNSGGLASFTQNANAGVLDFRFLTNGGTNGVINGGQNINAAGPSGPRKPDFIASIVGSPDALHGDSAYLLVDDLGGGPDDDYDDMMIRIDIATVALPAGGLLMGSALVGLGLVRRRMS